MSLKTVGFGVLACFGLCSTLAPDLAAQSTRRDLVLREGNADRLPQWDPSGNPWRVRKINGPVLDFVFDPQEGLRPLLGIPGATVWGEVIPLPDIAEIVVSVERDYALAISAKDRQPLLVRGLSGLIRLSALGDEPGVDQIALSPSGTAAALYRAAAQSVQVWAGLPDSPLTRWRATVPGPVEAIAVADDGDVAIAAIAGDDRRFSVLLNSDAGWRYLSALEGQASISFLRDSADAVLADSATNQLYLVGDAAGAAQIFPLAGERDGIAQPVGVAGSADNRTVIVANSAPCGVSVVNLAGGVETIACGSPPTGLQRITGNSVFRLSAPGLARSYIFDGDSQQLRVLAVPPPVASSGAEGGVQ